MANNKEKKNLVDLFLQQAKIKGDSPFVWHKVSGNWESLTWSSAANKISAIARSLKDLGLKPGDRVGLISESRPEWPIADISIMAAGCITVPAYTTNGVSDHQHVLVDSGASAVIFSTDEIGLKVYQAALETSSVKFAISLEENQISAENSIPIYRWKDLLNGEKVDLTDLEKAAENTTKDDTACLIYTSGTGGVPKGVMLSHGAILSNCEGSKQLLKEMGLEDEVFLSFLPLSHSYEHTAGQFFPIMIGAQIYYAEGIEKLAQNMLETQPTLMTAVPRLYEVMHDRIQRGVRQAGGKTEKLFNKTVALGIKQYEDPKSMTFSDLIQNKLLTLLVRNKAKKRFGGRLKALVSGGAPLNYEIGVFFTALGIRLLQGYGQTESAPVISCNPPTNNKIKTVGPPLKDVEVEIAQDGEILVRGELIMQGYWNNLKATNEVIQNGWLHTGDIGELDSEGYIRITDRKKDIIVNSGGDNISPQKVEGQLTAQPEILQAMVYGDKRPHLVALLIPDPEFAKDWAGENAPDTLDIVVLTDNKDFKIMISGVIARVNENLSITEKIRRFVLSPEPFSVDNGMLTPTIKIRRHAIRQNFEKNLEDLYRS